MWPHRVILAVNITWYTNYLNSSLEINNTRYKPTNHHNSWNSFNFILHSDNCRIKFKGIVFFSWYIQHCMNLIIQLPAMGCSRHIGQGVTSWPKTRYNWVKTVLNLYHDSWKLDGSQHFMQNFPLLIIYMYQIYKDTYNQFYGIPVYQNIRVHRVYGVVTIILHNKLVTKTQNTSELIICD